MTDQLSADAAAAVAEIEATGIPPWHAMSVSAAREVEERVFSPADPPSVSEVTSFAIQGPGGSLPVRAYRPGRQPAPTVVFFHGGGFVLGTLDSIDGVCRRLCRRGPALVLSVDYRLAPEHPFPAAVEDAVAALEWAKTHAKTLGGDPDRLTVAGTSAGGTLATAAARNATQQSDTRIDHQILAYPMTDPTQKTDAHEEFADGPLLRRDDVAWFWRQYLRSAIDRANPYAAPARARTNNDLPPATILTAGVDVLRDEGQRYVTALREDGVPVDHHHHAGLPHGFLSLTESVPAADAALDTVAEAVAETN